MIEAFGSIWPYLLITIPLAVAVQMSGAARYINSAFQARPMVAILLATAVGAFSPFCSCSVTLSSAACSGDLEKRRATVLKKRRIGRLTMTIFVRTKPGP